MRLRWITLSALALLPGAFAQRMGFELAHGINSGYGMFQEAMTTPNGRQTLEQYLQTLEGVARVQGVTCNTKAFDVNKQVYENVCESHTTSYAKSVNQLARDVDKMILVGHSQGGLRSREFLQSVGDRNGDFSLARSKVTGLVTLGSPLNGAAIAQNAPGFAAWNIGLLFTSSMASSFWASGQASAWQGPAAAIAAAVVPILIAHQAVHDWVGAGRGDMSPNSVMVRRHNNIGGSCRWVLGKNGSRVNMANFSASQWVLVCDQQNPDYRPLPARVAVMNIVGQANHLDNFIGLNGHPIKVTADVVGLLNGIPIANWVSTPLSNLLTAIATATNGEAVWVAARMGTATYFGVLAVATWAIAWMPWNWWQIPAAIAQTALATEFAALPWVWNTMMVGSHQGDSIVPEDSQNYMFRNAARLGIGVAMIKNLPDGHHIGKRGEAVHPDTPFAIRLLYEEARRK